MMPPAAPLGRNLVVVAVLVAPPFLLADHVVAVVAVLVPGEARGPAVRMMLPVPARHVPDRGRHVARFDHAERAAIVAGAVPVAVVPDEPVDAVAEEVVLAIVIAHHVYRAARNHH